MDASLLERFTPVAKALKLDNAAAQQLAELYHAQITGLSDGVKKAEAAQIEAWQKDFTSAPDHAKVLASAKRALSVADAAAKSFFESPMVGNNPVVIKFLAKVGGFLSEDKLVESNPLSPKTEGATAADFYPKSNMK